MTKNFGSCIKLKKRSKSAHLIMSAVLYASGPLGLIRCAQKSEFFLQRR